MKINRDDMVRVTAGLGVSEDRLRTWFGTATGQFRRAEIMIPRDHSRRIVVEISPLHRDMVWQGVCHVMLQKCKSYTDAAGDVDEDWYRDGLSLRASLSDFDNVDQLCEWIEKAISDAGSPIQPATTEASTQPAGTAAAKPCAGGVCEADPAQVARRVPANPFFRIDVAGW